MSSLEIREWIFLMLHTQKNKIETYDQVNQTAIDLMNFIRRSISERVDTLRQSMVHQREQWNTNSQT